MSSTLPPDFGSYRQILAISIPLVFAHTGVMLMQFVDALFLSWYSEDAIAAVGASGLLFYGMASLFIGIASYTSTFVAQYIGAGRPERVGAAVWQGMYAALLSGVLVALLAFAARPLFGSMNHEPAVTELEIIYFRILCYGAPLTLMGAALSGFFSGRGDNRVLMAAQIAGALTNAVLDYAMIFGHWGFPEMGMAGAAWATVIGQGVITFTLAALFLSRRHRETFDTWKDRPFEAVLFLRLMRYGLPAGVRMFVEVMAWATFLIFIGRTGATPMAASSIAFRVNGFAFFPLLGLSIGLSMLVGQAQGAVRPDLSEKVIRRGVFMGEAWMLVAALVFVLFPGPIMDVFHDPAATSVESFAELRQTGIVLLRFVALYTLLDGMNILLVSALQGAGDTRWTLIATAIAYSLFLPLLLLLDHLKVSAYVLWSVATVFVMLLALVWVVRFLSGKWKPMRVIEYAPPDVEITSPQVM